MVSSRCFRKVKYLADAEDNIYEAQSRLLDNERASSAASIETAIVRLGKALEDEAISVSEHTEYTHRLSDIREQVVRAHGKENFERVVGDLKKLREELLAKTFDKVIECQIG